MCAGYCGCVMSARGSGQKAYIPTFRCVLHDTLVCAVFEEREVVCCVGILCMPCLQVSQEQKHTCLPQEVSHLTHNVVSTVVEEKEVRNVCVRACVCGCAGMCVTYLQVGKKWKHVYLAFGDEWLDSFSGWCCSEGKRSDLCVCLCVWVGICVAQALCGCVLSSSAWGAKAFMPMLEY